jgi:hypothetical protein
MLSLRGLTVEELVERFTALGLGQDQAVDDDDNAAFGRLYRQVEAVEGELKLREGDQRTALLSLLDHPSAQVRINAAMAVLAVAPRAAREGLQRIVDRGEFPQAADARGMLRALDEGTYEPS